MRTRTVYPKLTLVGAGPGDPDLISIKGIKALKAADVVLYDALTHPDLLNYVSHDCKVEYVGKRAGEHCLTQPEINRLIVEYALKYGHVVRLKGGDPFVFGRGYEEIEAAEQYDIETFVIPGISSATSLAGIQKIPLTMRGINESFWVLTGTNKIFGLARDIEIAANTNATVVILMGFSKLPEIVSLYKRLGMNYLPIAVIQNGSLPDEKIALGTIDTIEGIVAEMNMGIPATIVIGEVVGLAKNNEHISETLLRYTA